MPKTFETNEERLAYEAHLQKRREYYAANKERCLARSHDWADRNREHVKAVAKVWRAKNRDKLRKYFREYNRQDRKAHPEKWMHRSRKIYWGNPEHYREVARQRYRQTKAEFLEAYGSRCVCCGETESDFLTADHVNNDGAQHRMALKQGKKRAGSGSTFYRWLKQHHWPAIFQILCYNCNCAKGFFGECPHERARREQKVAAD